MFCRMRRWRKEILALVDMRFRVFHALCKRFGACLVGDDGPPPAARVHKPTSTLRNMVVTTARAMTMMARAMVAEATRMMVTTVTTTAATATAAATMTPNGDKHHNKY
jgi:hypothetical protein